MNNINVDDLGKNSPMGSVNSVASVAVKQPRSSNLELYRIICMLMIVAHHYVVNSGLYETLVTDPLTTNSLFLTIFGAWGKTGINCFVLITGYFMCTSKITIRKFIKLMAEIYLYKLLIYIIFLFAGYETFTPFRLLKLLMPTWELTTNFAGCFIFFWWTLPFLNILVQNMNKRQHELLLILMLTMYTLLGSIITFDVWFNYVSWFGIIFFIASYIRLYPNPIFERKRLWGWMTLTTVVLAIVSILAQRFIFGARLDMGYHLVSDSNKIFAVSVAVCSFLWFKNMKINYSRVINTIAAGTFGVFLIHANSSAMRVWLWKDTVDAVGHYATLSIGNLILYSIGVVLVIFVICNLIDQLRILTLEKWFMNWYDKKYADKEEALIDRITLNK